MRIFVNNPSVYDRIKYIIVIVHQTKVTFASNFDFSTVMDPEAPTWVFSV